LDLGVTLAQDDEFEARSLSDDDRTFLFRGLGQLVDHMFIHSARSIQMVNPAGVHKIKRDIMSLQEVLRGINLPSASDEGVLTRAIAYWDMYELGPKVSHGCRSAVVRDSRCRRKNKSDA
jgi:exocyst complex component 4